MPIDTNYAKANKAALGTSARTLLGAAATLDPTRGKAAPARTDPCADTAPACPVCGGLKCLCRPRFFPGQLLSDEDLNRLQQYVIDKNRLHNRHLVGWGVACGLEVACSPCDGSSVTVRSGYALSPCGDDIVVCADQAVDICQLIQTCRPARSTVCDPPYSQTPTDCAQGVERWVLAVCYDESPSRGISALTGAGDSLASGGCRCGGGGGGGCSCGGKKAAGSSGCGCGGGGSSASASGCSCGARSSAYQSTSTRRNLLPQCEPTQICEGFRFTAYKAPVATKTGLTGLDTAASYDKLSGNRGDLMIAWLYANRARFGPLLERTLCCVLQAMDLRAQLVEGRQLAAAGAVGAYLDYAQALQAFAADFSLHHCSFVGEVRTQYESAQQWSRTRMSGDLNAADRAELVTRYRALDTSWMAIASECLCSALLPPCPPSSNSNCVPLAVVTVDNASGACRVVDICNWQERKLLITWPTITYWLSWLPWQRLREWVARICCNGSDQRSAYTLMMVMLGVAVAGARSSASSVATPVDAVVKVDNPLAPVPKGAEAVVAASGLDAALDSPNLLLHMLADFETARSGSASATGWAALAARSFDGSAFAPLAGSPAVQKADLKDIDQQLGLADLREQMASLQQTVARQNEILRALQIVNGNAATGSNAATGGNA